MTSGATRNVKYSKGEFKLTFSFCGVVFLLRGRRGYAGAKGICV
jgi:hypothetical protein